MIANIKKTLKIKRSNYLVFLFLFLFLLEIPGLVYISSLPRYPEINYSINIIPVFSKNDNVLILAPHPDDEAIANAGIIQEALKAGSAVKVVVFTNGDFNSTSLPFIEKTKNPAGAPQEFLKLGEVRRSESISAMQTLGLKKDNLIFLGYPDFGTLEIFLKYWDTENPYQSLATKETKVPYPDSYSYGADYKGESVLKDLESIISGYKPTKIFIPNSFDSHKDHRAMYLFAQVALWDLKDIIQGYQVFTYLTHVKNWPLKFNGLSSPNDETKPPEQLTSNEVSWYELKLTDEEEKKKYDSIQNYQSQLAYVPSFYLSFIHRNELFCDFSKIVLNSTKAGEINWKRIDIFERADKKIVKIENLKDFYYATDQENFYTKFKLTREIDKDFELLIYQIGYRSDREFSKMPKIAINISMDGCKIFNQVEQVSINDFYIKTDNENYFIKMPLKDLGNPQFLLSCVESRLSGETYENTAWRIIELD
jgi:N-acetyl-1-D-myo-inositol-2-amino-2-deoxy-alpha-D-glucopyranoside deacetylase